MNCDQVFNILTRGPFPSGDPTDASVETHLSLCAACRHFADALRPDGSTDAESLVPEESRGLPYYWGLAALPGGEHGSSLTIAEARRQTQRQRKPTFFERHEPLAHLSGWQLAFAVLMGATLGTLLRFLGYSDSSPPKNEMIASAAPMIHGFDPHHSPTDIGDNETDDSATLTPACCENRLPGFRSDESIDDVQDLAAYANHSSLCCTQCHNASSQRFALRATTLKIIRSCNVCHQDRDDLRIGSRE